MTEQTVEQVLAEAAQASEAANKPKKERKPKTEAAEGSAEPKAKKERKPKEPKAPKLDADGNPIVPKARNAVRDDQTLHITDKGVEAKFREGTKRHENFAAIADGMTAGDYFAKVEGGRASVGTFLVWYINEGYVEVGGNAVDVQSEPATE